MFNPQRGNALVMVLIGLLITCVLIIAGAYFLNTGYFRKTNTQPQIADVGSSQTIAPSASTLQNKIINPKTGKPNNTTGCVGTYLYYENKNSGLWGYALEKDYDFYELEELAISKGMKVNIQEDYSYLSRTLEDARKYYKLGMELKEGDNIKKGQLSIIVINNEVKITGPYMRINKSISEEESYELTFSYLPDDYLKQGIQVVQNGSCDFQESYIKEQVVSLLDSLDTESDWVNTAKVEINSTGSIDL